MVDAGVDPVNCATHSSIACHDVTSRFPMIVFPQACFLKSLSLRYNFFGIIPSLMVFAKVHDACVVTI
jgi:hypothetical protein